VSGDPDDERRCERVEVSVNNHRVTLRAGGIAGRELKQEAAAQGAKLQLGFRLWIRCGDRYAAVYDADVIDASEGQEYLALTSDDHARPPPTPTAERAFDRAMNPPADGWSLVLPPPLWADLSNHVLADGAEHAGVILADRASGQRGHRLLGRVFIPARDDIDYLEGTPGYWSLSPEFIRDAAVRAKREESVYLGVHNYRGDTAIGFSPIDLASHERGYPALRRITGQPVGAVVLSRRAAAGELWLSGDAREPLAELVVPACDAVRLCPPGRG